MDNFCSWVFFLLASVLDTSACCVGVRRNCLFVKKIFKNNKRNIFHAYSVTLFLPKKQDVHFTPQQRYVLFVDKITYNNRCLRRKVQLNFTSSLHKVWLHRTYNWLTIDIHLTYTYILPLWKQDNFLHMYTQHIYWRFNFCSFIVHQYGKVLGNCG